MFIEKTKNDINYFLLSVFIKRILFYFDDKIREKIPLTTENNIERWINNEHITHN